jgi:hypothetical protein
MTLVQALALTLEEIQGKELSELAELHSVLATSKQKKAKRQADLVAGIINAKKKELKAAEPAEAKEEEKEPVLVGAENSAKPKLKGAKPKANRGGKAAKPKAKPAQKEEPEEDQDDQPEADKPKADQPEPKKPKSLKRKKKDTPDVSKMSKEELEKLAVQLIENDSRFPKEISGKNTTFKKAEFETLEEIQAHLMEQPLSLYVFADERLDDSLTQFQLLFANAEVIVLLDRNRKKNSTVTIKTDQLEAEHLAFDKERFEYSFYVRETK